MRSVRLRRPIYSQHMNISITASAYAVVSIENRESPIGSRDSRTENGESSPKSSSHRVVESTLTGLYRLGRLDRLHRLRNLQSTISGLRDSKTPDLPNNPEVATSGFAHPTISKGAHNTADSKTYSIMQFITCSIPLSLSPRPAKAPLPSWTEAPPQGAKSLSGQGGLSRLSPRSPRTLPP